MRRPGKATAHAAWNFVMSLLMSLSRMNRARSFTVQLLILSLFPPCAAPQSLLQSRSPFAADESTGLRLSSSLPDTALEEIQAPRVEAEAVVHLAGDQDPRPKLQDRSTRTFLPSTPCSGRSLGDASM